MKSRGRRTQLRAAIRRSRNIREALAEKNRRDARRAQKERERGER
jgi:hypothetical protein